MYKLQKYPQKAHTKMHRYTVNPVKKKKNQSVCFIYIFSPRHQRGIGFLWRRTVMHLFFCVNAAHGLVCVRACTQSWMEIGDAVIWHCLQKHQREWNSNYQHWTGMCVCVHTVAKAVKQNLMSCYGNSLNPVAQLVTSNSSAPDYWHWSSMISCSFFSHSYFSKQLGPGRGTFVFQK